ncbi:DNA protecting protein DprA [Delftia tsuruhatensis]|uniref:DNA-processing protein DprA n=1 Tax=Delftia tsuruhatensis TaxID=180282 RepID=UPI001E6D00AD|nr:DNA-processing protein DprA [Delftia tsuruhatensis]CAB5700781.1 DNA protecting protein DprA [Delftia tsuruhatensis]CAC9693455.1 DNA protecting protein DprA [Delftia tsuruhatensis]
MAAVLQPIDRMAPEELRAWLRLLLTPGVGRATARRLLAACDGVLDIWGGPPSRWQRLVTEAQAHALGAMPPRLEPVLSATGQWLDEAVDGQLHAVVPLGHPRYPQALLQTEDPPLLLHVQGSVQCMVGAGPWFPYPQSLAMVGSRSPTAQGASNARAMAQALAEAGLCIVSGLAQGVDGAAHEGALRAVPGMGLENMPRTIAVVGTGLDQVYPRSHTALAREVACQGLIVSEYPLGTGPMATNFPQRNRIIAGLSQGTLVVEAALQSGSLITARLASEQGREVFAIPGSIHAPQSRGCHALLRQGAKLVETAQDVLDELQGMATRLPAMPSPSAAAPAPEEDRDPTLRALSHDPLSLDALMDRTGMDAAVQQARLLELELEGRIERLPGGLYQRLSLA